MERSRLRVKGRPPPIGRTETLTSRRHARVQPAEPQDIYGPSESPRPSAPGLLCLTSRCSRCASRQRMGTRGGFSEDGSSPTSSYERNPSSAWWHEVRRLGNGFRVGLPAAGLDHSDRWPRAGCSAAGMSGREALISASLPAGREAFLQSPGQAVLLREEAIRPPVI